MARALVAAGAKVALADIDTTRLVPASSSPRRIGWPAPAVEQIDLAE